ncbi:MAG: GNAT family N-acetyltransferase [Gemmatimonadales bacterium]|nr:GNAT family N-acetyltransferase [Gemmatimonadales bacterium]
MKLVVGTAAEGVTARQPVQVERFYADVPWIGKGVGGFMMEAVIERARSAGHDGIWLAVWEHNSRAMAFYERWGFTVVGRQDFLLGSDLQNDLVMERLLATEPPGGACPASGLPSSGRAVWRLTVGGPMQTPIDSRHHRSLGGIAPAVRAAGEPHHRKPLAGHAAPRGRGRADDPARGLMAPPMHSPSTDEDQAEAEAWLASHASRLPSGFVTSIDVVRARNVPQAIAGTPDPMRST